MDPGMWSSKAVKFWRIEMKRSKIQSFPVKEPDKRIEGVRVGRIAAIGEDGEITVDFVGNLFGPIAARFASSLKLHALHQAASAGNEVLIVFENNDPRRPIIIDTISSRLAEIAEPENIDLEFDKQKDVTIDGEKITFNAKEQVVIKCGKASITLTRVGKILIRGAYLLNRSTGVNRIKGGSVQIN
jgi:Domain of unknown function (DUF6484)